MGLHWLAMLQVASQEGIRVHKGPSYYLHFFTQVGKKGERFVCVSGGQSGDFGATPHLICQTCPCQGYSHGAVAGLEKNSQTPLWAAARASRPCAALSCPLRIVALG